METALSPVVVYAVVTLVFVMLVLVVPAGARWRQVAWPASMPTLSPHRPGDLLGTPRTPYWRSPNETQDLRRPSYFTTSARRGRRPASFLAPRDHERR
ncbi:MULTISPECIES: hypothetical protein [Pandoraea]|uniref:Uncharacterized protein n=1 Tax=Pandoraea communis TaxID=2508297 RepID=A0A5E4VF02_9BURK|nr:MULTISPECIES: hypothetical protein [Pandoraea]EON10778.1 hypothetical protein C266_24910 [Pandoraea sp. SD6-2]MDM8359336.1 hypothetical protein [Pandoraea communis]VVE10731.1 hypothetical protein PCO31111_02639 [Pandoraea communis]VVE38239.1 hypothetical protein PCO31110_04054 [Pandoraea communis]